MPAVRRTLGWWYRLAICLTATAATAAFAHEPPVKEKPEAPAKHDNAAKPEAAAKPDSAAKPAETAPPAWQLFKPAGAGFCVNVRGKPEDRSAYVELPARKI